MTPATELDRLFSEASEQIAGLSIPKKPDPLPLKDATPVPAYPNPRPGSEL